MCLGLWCIVGTSILGFFGEQTARGVVCRGCSVVVGVGHSTEGVGGGMSGGVRGAFGGVWWG